MVGTAHYLSGVCQRSDVIAVGHESFLIKSYGLNTHIFIGGFHLLQDRSQRPGELHLGRSVRWWDPHGDLRADSSPTAAHFITRDGRSSCRSRR